MILPLSGTAVLDIDIQGFFSWSLTGHSLPLEPFLVTHLLHFCQLVMTILMVIIELIGLLSLLSQTLNFYEKYRLDKAPFAFSDENVHKSESLLLSTGLFSCHEQGHFNTQRSSHLCKIGD